MDRDGKTSKQLMKRRSRIGWPGLESSFSVGAVKQTVGSKQQSVCESDVIISLVKYKIMYIHEGAISAI